jgi:hypothetical protein
MQQRQFRLAGEAARDDRLRDVRDIRVLHAGTSVVSTR